MGRPAGSRATGSRATGSRGTGPDGPPVVGPGREAVLAVLRRVDLWPIAVRQSLRLAPRGWWRRAPFLPLPARDYLHFRMVTAYGGDGDPDLVPDADPADDLVTYLEWCRSWPGR
ncbi:MAG: hypothetical protein KGR17_09495 [Acidobacteria bacterium]|nr:hypothetical protein [Acidobacteriota bacterium]